MDIFQKKINFLRTNRQPFQIQTKHTRITRYYKWLDYFNTVLDKIRDSTFYLNKNENNRDKMVIACLLLDSHWNPIDQKILLHTALGNGFSSPKLGIFGSHLTHSWPENVNEIESIFDF